MTNDLEHSPEEWGNAIVTSRLLLLLETKDGFFRQMQFTEEQFKKISDFIDEEILPDAGGDKRVLRVSRHRKLPEDTFLGWQSHYPDPDNLPDK